MKVRLSEIPKVYVLIHHLLVEKVYLLISPVLSLYNCIRKTGPLPIKHGLPLLLRL